MARIFFSLSLFAVLLMGANLVVGLCSGDMNAAARQYSEAERAFRLRHDSGATKNLKELEEARLAALNNYEPFRKHATTHILLGLAAALVTVLVNSITVTYFIGTNRWVREVCDTYHLDQSLQEKSNLLKKRAFPWSVLGISATIAIVTFGAASDPSALGAERASNWVSAHFLCACIGIALIAYALLKQVAAIGANYEVIEEVVKEVNAIREAKGLET